MPSSLRSQLSIVHKFAHKANLPQRPDRLWLIEKGMVRSLTWNPAGYITTLGIWGQGDVVGLPLTPLRPYAMECLTPVVVTEVGLVSPNHPWPDLLLRHIWRSQELLNIVRQPTLAEGLLSLLYWLADRFGQPVEQGLLLEPVLTHQQISEVLGSSRVTVTRMLNQMEKEGRLWRLRDRERRLVTLLNQRPQLVRSRRAIVLPKATAPNQAQLAESWPWPAQV
jgi:CRP-like cAMP-binding protein